jgi:hypothetical protein
MALTGMFVMHKVDDGERYVDGSGIYLRVKTTGKYWRVD